MFSRQREPISTSVSPLCKIFTVSDTTPFFGGIRPFYLKFTIQLSFWASMGIQIRAPGPAELNLQAWRA